MEDKSGPLMPLNQFVKKYDSALDVELQLILNAVEEGVCGVDAEGKATFCNDPLLRMTGYRSEELLGQNLHELLHHSQPDGSRHRTEECSFCKAIAAHEAMHLATGVLWRKDGTCFPADYWVRPLERSFGLTGCVITVKDITGIEQTKGVLRQSEERFRRILASSPDVAWTSDQNGRTIYVSPKAEGVLGYSKQEVCAARAGLWLGRIHPEDFGRVNQAYRNLFEKQTSFDEEYRIRRKDSKWIWVHDRSVGTHQEDGIAYADGFLCDITLRKAAEAELRSQTALLEAQVHCTLDGILVVNGRGQRLMQNQRLSELFDIPSDLLEEKDDENTLKYVVSLIKDPESFLAKVNHLYKHPEQTSRDEIELKNGTFLDRYSAPVVDKNGIYYGRIWTFRDITARKRAEKEVRLTQFSVEHASDAIQWIDSSGRIVYVNRASCTSFQRTREELLELALSDISPAFPRGTWETFWEQLKTRGAMTFESQVQTKSGEIFPVEITANYLKFDGQEYCFGFARDIRERRALEGQLRHAQKLEGVGQLAAGIAHEINTPTQFVSDNLTFLRDSWKSAYELLELYRHSIRKIAGNVPAAMAETLKQAEQKCDLGFIASEVPLAIDQSLDGTSRVAKIVRAMKEFSHPDSVDKTAADLNKTIESTITVARNEWKYVSEIVMAFDPTLPLVECYPGDINQVVLNLIVNAAHSIKEKIKEGEKGRITVGTKTRDGLVEISVRDTGKGIPPAIQGKVFDPFFTTKEVGKGTGQGLALAYTVVVKKHAGKIWFETEVGQGTTFYITLPVKLANPAART
jgi:PAS domain S-box-containing protein